MLQGKINLKYLRKYISNTTKTVKYFRNLRKEIQREIYIYIYIMSLSYDNFQVDLILDNTLNPTLRATKVFRTWFLSLILT